MRAGTGLIIAGAGQRSNCVVCLRTRSAWSAFPPHSCLARDMPLARRTRRAGSVAAHSDHLPGNRHDQQPQPAGRDGIGDRADPAAARKPTRIEPSVTGVSPDPGCRPGTLSAPWKGFAGADRRDTGNPLLRSQYAVAGTVWTAGK